MKRTPLFLALTGAALAVAAGVAIVHPNDKGEAPEPPRTFTPAEKAPEPRTPWSGEGREVLRDAGRVDSWWFVAEVIGDGADAGRVEAHARARAIVGHGGPYEQIVRDCYKQEGRIGGALHVVFDVAPSGAITRIDLTPALSTHVRTPACLSSVPRVDAGEPMTFPPAEYAMQVTTYMVFDPREGRAP